MSISIDRQDGLSSATAFKGPCRVATTANLLLLEGLLTIDGITLVVDDRVLVKNQTAANENGVYVVDTGTWRRAKDFSRTDDVETGTQVLVTDGTTSAGKTFYVSTEGEIIVGTTNIVFSVMATIIGNIGITGADLIATDTPQEAADIIYPPVTGNTLYLADFIRLTPLDPVLALRTAIIELFTTGSGPMVLECQGIPISITSSFQIRTSDVTFGVSKAFRTISNLRLIATGAGWSDLDYMFSLCGDQTLGNLRFFKLKDPVFDMSGNSLVALHATGYYIYEVYSPSIIDIGPDAICIYSSRWMRTSGISTLVTDGAGGSGDPNDGSEQGNHGMEIIYPDIVGDFGRADNTVGIYTEDGDFNVTGGNISWVNTGIWTKRGQLNTRNVHYSMAEGVEDKVAVRCDAPRGVSLIGDECDGCVYVFDNPPANAVTPGTSYEGWNSISVKDFKFNSNADSPAGVNFGGIVNFLTRTLNSYINCLTVEPDWAVQLVTSIDVKNIVKFKATGSGSWDGASFSNFILRDTDGFGILGADLPDDVVLYLARAVDGAGPDSAGVAWNGNNKSMEWYRAATTNRPSIRAEGNDIVIGSNIAGVFTELVRIESSGKILFDVGIGGWTTQTGTDYKLNYNPATVTLVELAQFVKGVAKELVANGILRA